MPALAPAEAGELVELRRRVAELEQRVAAPVPVAVDGR